MFDEIENTLGEKLVSHSSVGGGCIANSQIIETEKGNKYFLKSYSRQNSIIQSEANGLLELAKANAIQIPNVISVTDKFLILEYFPTGKRREDFSELFGNQLAEMHKTTSKKFGFFENNFIGSNRQINLPLYENWIDFFWENRLLFQFKLAEKNGYVDSSFRNIFAKLEKLLPSIIEGTEEPPTLLHGDLWSGNFIVNQKGDPVLIDPAVYYGHREMELAMTKMFGGFDSKFYSVYNECNPLPDNWQYRLNLYMLYHVLNHLNLFGTGYYSQAISIIKYYLK